MELIVFAFVIGSIFLALWLKGKLDEAAKQESEEARKREAIEQEARAAREIRIRLGGPREEMPDAEKKPRPYVMIRTRPARPAAGAGVAKRRLPRAAPRPGKGVAPATRLAQAPAAPYVAAEPARAAESARAVPRPAGMLPLGALRNELQRGIVIAEILGPPRALRPFDRLQAFQ